MAPALAALAAVLVASGATLYLWAIRSPRTRYVRATSHLAWVLIALAPVVVVFSLFPDSSADGKIVGFSVGGAFGGFILVWWIGSRYAAKAIDADQGVAALRRQVQLLQQSAGAASAPGGAKVTLPDGNEWRYRVRGRKGTEVVVLTGDLRNVTVADVWISSENTNMQPARFYERSVSALVRYQGARRDAGGDPLDDVIADELAQKMRDLGKSSVQPGAVITTGAGELERTHNVKLILHVAAVRGEPNAGYVRVQQLDRCVESALAQFDAAAPSGARSILLPMLAAGVAAGDAASICRELVPAVAGYLRKHAESRVKRVYLLACSGTELRLWAAAADACEDLESAGGSAEPLIAAEDTPVVI